MTSLSIDDLVGQVIGSSDINNTPPPARPNTNDNNGKGKKDKKNGREQNKKQNIAKALDALEIIRSKCLELFVDQVGEPYAAIKVGDHIETIAIISNRFKDWIVKAYYDYRKEQQQEKLLDSENFDGQEEYGTIGDTTLSSSPLLNNEDV